MPDKATEGSAPPVFAPTSGDRSVLVISFYCGDEYYYRSAEALRDDCINHGMDHYIVEAHLPEPVSWITACRYKVRFISECLNAFKRPVLWMDADCRLLARPDVLIGCNADLALFLRGFRSFKEFDILAMPRVAQPSIMYYGFTPKTREFVARMADLERTHQGEATDDYFLQEAWLRFEKPLSLLLLSPDLVCFELPAKGSECFYFGRSFNAGTFKDAVQQHAIDLYTPTRRKAVLLREAGHFLRTGKRAAARLLLRRAHELDPRDEALAYRVARLLRREGKMEAALVYLRRFQRLVGDINHARRFQIDSALEANDIARAEAVAKDLIRRGNEVDASWARSRLLRIGLERRALERGLDSSERPALWWMESPYPGNFGDILNPYIIERLSGRPPRLAPKGKGILAIGSTIKYARAGTAVWGTGTPRMSDRLDTSADYYAVRGPLTHRLINQSGGSCTPIYGDPSWFLPRLYRPNCSTKRYRLGLVLHHAHIGEIRTSSDVKQISVLRGSYEEIERFIDEIHECECILSTSLHGLIVAHAYGIPARWCDVPDAAKQPPGDQTKFHDYLLSVGLHQETPLHLPKGSLVTEEHAKTGLRLPEKGIDLEALAAVAPFDVTYDWRRPL